MEQLSRVANAWCEWDCLDTLHELPEYTKTYLTYVIPELCKSSRPKRKAFTRLKLENKHMSQSVPHKKVSLDWHCLSFAKMLNK